MKLRLLLIFLSMSYCISSMFFFHLDAIIDEYYFIGFLVLSFGTIAYLFNDEHFLSSMFGFSFTVAYYFAMCTFFGGYCKTTWYFEAFDYGCNQKLHTRSLLVYVSSHSIYFLIILSYIKKIPWNWEGFSNKFKSKSFSLAIFFGLLGTLIFYLSSYPASTDVLYASGKAYSPMVPGAILNFLAPMLLIIGFVTIHLVDKYDSKTVRLYLLYSLAVIFYFPLMSGDRSGAIGFFIVWFILFYKLSLISKIKKIVGLAIAFISFYVLMIIVGAVRSLAYSYGLLVAVERGWRNLLKEAFKESTSNFSIYLDSSLADAFQQMHWHMINAVKYYDIGKGDNGISFFNLLPQSIPEYVAMAIGFERPLGATESLRALVPHGGGFYIYAQGYFNYGIIGAFITAIVFGTFIVIVENSFKNSNSIMYGAYFAYLSTLMNGVLYSWQPLIKEIQMFILLSIFINFLFRFSLIKRRNPINTSEIIIN
jgi:hypothetical protein